MHHLEIVKVQQVIILPLHKTIFFSIILYSNKCNLMIIEKSINKL